MKKRLLLLLCLTLTAGSAAWADIASGKWNNGHWFINDEGELYVNVNHVSSDFSIPDYGEGKAPWYKYAERITAIRIGPNCRNIGRNAFYGLRYVQKVTGGENVESIAMYAFEKCGGGNRNNPLDPIPSIIFPQCSYVGKKAFYNTSVLSISLLLVETYKADAILYSGVFIDLGKEVEMLRPGSVFGPDYIFIENPTPPDWARLYSRDEEEESYEYASNGRAYRYPFGDNVPKVIVPQEYLQTYIDYYPSEHPEVKKGYMCARYLGTFGGFGGEYLPGSEGNCGRLVAGAPIYKDGQLIGGWYVDDDDSELNLVFSGSTMPSYESGDAPWNSLLEEVTKLRIMCLGKEFHVPDYAFSAANAQNPALRGIREVIFAGSDLERVVIGNYAFRDNKELEKINPRFITQIGVGCFMGCKNLRNDESYKRSFPSFAHVPDFAFCNCEKLTRYDFSETTTIGNSAFEGTNLSNLDLNQIKSVGSNAFANSSIKRIKFGLSTQDSKFGSKCFAGCNKLEEIDANSELVWDNIPNDMFDNLDLSSIVLIIGAELYSQYYKKHPLFGQMHVSRNFDCPVGSIEEGWVISGGSSPYVLKIYKDFNFSSQEEQPWYSYQDFITSIYLDPEVTKIGDYEFAGMKITSANLSRDCKEIGNYAFKDCQSLRFVELYYVEFLGNNVFEGCTSLGHIYLGWNLQKAGDYVFKNCTSLELIGNRETTPAETTQLTFAEIGSEAYQLRGGKRKAASGQAAVTLDVPDEFVTNYIIDPNWGKFHIKFADSRGTWEHAGPFGDGTWILYDDSTMVISADKGPGENNENWSWSALRFNNEIMRMTKRIEFSGKMTYLDNCFEFFENLESVTLSPSIKTLNGTFSDCQKLRSINLENVTTLGESALSNTGLTTIDLSNVKSVGRYAFYNCQKLVYAKLGSQCNVGKDVFGSCSALTSVDLGDVNLDNANRCFTGCTSLKTVKYNGRYLPHNIFSNCTALREVRLGDKVSAIYWDAFEGCTALNTVYCDSPTPPILPKGVTQDILYYDAGVVPVYGPEYDVWAFNGLTLSDISLYLSPDYIPAYRRTNIWKDMNIVGDEEYEYEPLLPTGGSLGSNGTWYLSEDGTLIIDAGGDIPASDPEGKPWCYTFNSWAGYIKTVIVADGVTSIPDDFFGGLYFNEISSSIETVKLGRFLKSVGKNSLSFSGIKDVYVHSEELLDLKKTTFDLEAAVSNNATLHVPKTSDNTYINYYLNNSATSRFPHIVADIHGLTIASGTLGTQGYWTFADGVLTITYNGAMPTITKSVTDPEQAFRYKWIDFLSEIEEIDIIGKDVEIQPYLLYYEGDGPSGSHPDDHIKTVKLGEGVKSIGRAALSLYALKNLYCYSEQPPTLPAAINSTYKAFWASRISANLTFLHVPKGAKSHYGLYNTEWANFANMIDDLFQELAPKQKTLLDFETGNLGQFAFVNNSQYPWDVTIEDAAGGAFSMKSGNKGVHNSSSTISIVYFYESDGILSFNSKCMGEGSGDGWDKCRFYIDGEQQFSYGALGNVWHSRIYPVTAGMHTFTWEYTKDSSVDAEGDAFFVDNIYFLQEGKNDDIMTGIEDLKDSKDLKDLEDFGDTWYDLSGRKLDGKPIKPGLYINGGKKVMVK